MCQFMKQGFHGLCLGNTVSQNNFFRGILAVAEGVRDRDIFKGNGIIRNGFHGL